MLNQLKRMEELLPTFQQQCEASAPPGTREAVLAATIGIKDKHSAIGKFRAQIPSLSSHVGVWWLWVEKILLGLSVDATTQQWLKESLLPTLYWHHQMHKTQNHAHRSDGLGHWDIKNGSSSAWPLRLFPWDAILATLRRHY